MPHLFQGQKVLSISESAQILDVTPFVIRRMVRDGELPALRLGHLIHVFEAGVLGERKRLDRDIVAALTQLSRSTSRPMNVVSDATG